MREGFTFLPSPAYSIQQADSQAVAVKGKITKRSEGCEGEAFTLIIQVINELRTKSEEVKAKIENSLKRAHSRDSFASEICGNFAPFTRFPFQDGIRHAMCLEPRLRTSNHFVEFLSAWRARQLRAALLATHPRNRRGRIRINGHFRPLFVEKSESMDNREELADIVRAVNRTEMKDLAPLRQINTPIFHRPGIAGTSRIDTKRLETHFRQHLGRGHVHRSGIARGGTRSTRRNISATRSSVVHIGRSHCRTLSRAGGTNMLFRFVGRGILRFVARSEGFVTCTGETVDLFAAFLPRGVDSGDAAAPNNIELGFLATHEQENGLKNKGRAAEKGRSERKGGDFVGTLVPRNRPMQ